MDGDANFAGEFALLPIIPDDYHNHDEIDHGPHKPFQSIHKRPTSFKTKHHPGIWFPTQPISVKVTLDKRPVHRINSNLYKIDLTHGDFSWTIYRRYKHIRSLHEQLRLFLATCKIPMPTKQHRERRRSVRQEKSELPRFPLLPDQFVREENIQLRAKQLEDYLQNILQFRVYRNHIETLKFLEVSYLSFLKQFGPKRKEGMIMKRVGGCSLGCLNCTHLLRCGKSWRKRWLIIKDTFLTFIRPKDGAIRDVLLLDTNFTVKSESGVQHIVVVSNSYRELMFSCWTHRKQTEWVEQIQQITDGTGKEFTEAKRFCSFAPVRTDSIARWFVDGDIYFEAVADNLEAASEEIFITDWWLSPELYLKRMDHDRNNWRLDVVLERKAKAGVKVFILLYKEIALALGINSYYSKHKLMECENIKVLRHPDHIPGGVYLWAHHEKLVVIDQKVAFLGGFDLCYGRWDGQDHRLDDLGSTANNVPRTADSESRIIEKSPQLLVESTVANVNVTESTLDISKDVMHLGGSKDTINSGNPEHSEKTEITSLSSEATNASSIMLDKLKIDIPRSEDSNNSANASPHLSLTKPGLASLAMSVKCEQVWRNKALDRRALYSQHKKMSLCRSFSTGADVLNKGPLKCYSRNMSVLESSNSNMYENILERYSRLENHVPIIQEAEETKNNNSAEKNGKSEMNDDEKSSLVRRRWRLYLNVSKLVPPVNDKVTVSNIPGLDEKSANMKPSTPKSKRRFMDRCITNCQWRGSSLENKSLLSSSESQQTISAVENAAKIWIGKDYCNFICKDFVDLEAPFEDMIDRTKTPRMPWHDIGMVVYGKAAKDAARHFIQRWNITKVKKVRNDPQYPFLFPKSGNTPSNMQTSGKMTLQVLRSVSQWSAGTQQPENSIHEAYIDCIQKAKHFIYIENQFFISKSSADNTVLNKINEALFHRIFTAHCNKQTFRVYIVMPLLPAFEGELGTNKGTAIQAITHWNYSSICRGEDSLLVKLRRAGVHDPFKYITFYGLRNHGELLGKLTTELVYVHSKMMIVDDDTTIIGSANINDRSMLGVRDSEIAVMVQDLEKFSVEFDGNSHLVGYFSSTLRRTLFREHLGIAEDDDSIDLSDPVCNSFYKEIWIRQASINTGIYEKVFHCLPSDHVLTFDDLRRYSKEPALSDSNPEEARNLLTNIRGHLVLIPLLFLEKERLTPSAGSKEALLPTNLWT